MIRSLLLTALISLLCVLLASCATSPLTPETQQSSHIQWKERISQPTAIPASQAGTYAMGSLRLAGKNTSEAWPFSFNLIPFGHFFLSDSSLSWPGEGTGYGESLEFFTQIIRRTFFEDSPPENSQIKLDPLPDNTPPSGLPFKFNLPMYVW